MAIDGKTLWRSYDKSNNKAAIHMVSAWATNSGIVLGQIKTEEKSNEIAAIHNHTYRTQFVKVKKQH